MVKRIVSIFEPFILALLTTVLLASVLPAHGAGASLVAVMADIGIVMLFFLHGAKLSREAIIDGARNWRLHLGVLATTFALFPLLGSGLRALPFVAPGIGAGLLFLSLLPSTVQSSIAFTSIARGNVAAAVCSASLSNLLGIVITPLLAAVLMRRDLAHGGGFSLRAVETIVVQLLLPFLAGHGLRRWIGSWVGRHKRMLSLVDRGSILLVVYSAFSAAVLEGLWHRMSPQALLLILACCATLLFAVLAITWGGGRLLGLSREDAIVLLFCGSKKSLASGVPMAGVLFAPADVGTILLPLMLFHQLQLIVCAIIARHYGARPRPISQPAAGLWPSTG